MFTATYRTIYTTTQADIDVGIIQNTATAILI